MDPVLDLQPPQSYLQLCETLSSRECKPTVTPALGEFTRVLAASRPGGVFLALGRGAGELATWIHDGMDLSARMVIVIQSETEADMMRALLGNDLRVTVHVQDAVSFLRDVRDHRFDLIADLSLGHGADLTRLALGRLALGAFYMSLHAPEQLARSLGLQDAPAAEHDAALGDLHGQCFVLAHLRGDLGVSVLVRGPQKRQAKRRGGRRARKGVTPLFSSNPSRRR
jgi:hypothetical protein